MQPTIYFASDHAGFELKGQLVEFVQDVLGYEVIDCGAIAYDPQDDFTDYIAKAAREVSADPKNTRAIILGGSGQGEAMLANRFHDVRAAVYYGGNMEIVSLSRVHNDANVLSFGARFISESEAKEAVALWLQTKHEPVEKYDRRIDEIEALGKVQGVPISATKRSIVPSLPAKSFDEISALLSVLEGAAPGVQIDIVDGVFAPFVSWPFSETDVQQELQKLAPYAKDLEIEIDCMCADPQKYLDVFVSLGVSRVVMHAGSTNEYEACIQHAKDHGYKIGLGLRNNTPPQLLAKYVDDIDFVQVMGIEHIGKQGEPFDTKTFETIETIRHMYPDLEIAVDGGVSAVTIPQLLEVGANRFAPGSAVTKAVDPQMAYKQLALMIGL